MELAEGVGCEVKPRNGGSLAPAAGRPGRQKFAPQSRIFGTHSARPLDDLELEVQLLAAEDVGEIELPEFAREAEAGPVLV